MTSYRVVRICHRGSGSPPHDDRNMGPTALSAPFPGCLSDYCDPLHDQMSDASELCDRQRRQIETPGSGWTTAKR